MSKLTIPVRFLLLCALVLTIGRAMTMPFLTIYLTRRFGLDQQQVGMVMGGSLLIGTLAGLYCGYLTDRFDKRILVYGAIAIVTANFFVTPVLGNTLLIMLVLATTDTVFSLIDIALKSFFAELLPPEARGRAFSLRYMLANVGWSVGPMIGTLLAGQDPRWPFWLSGLVALVALILFACGHKLLHPQLTQVGSHSQVPNFAATARVLKDDSRLILFTLGGVFSAIIYSKFTVYLSQYAVTANSAQHTYQLISAMLVTNGIGVVLMQYPVGRSIRQDNLMRWVVIGSLMLTLAMFGFMQSTALPVWVLSMVIFTLGEVSLVPAEYLFIDAIAPEHLRGSYYGAQNLANFGSALSPILCGLVLTHAPTQAMFFMLIALAVAGAGMYWLGYRKMRQGLAVAVA